MRLSTMRLAIMGAVLANALCWASGAHAELQSTDGKSGKSDSALYVPTGGTDASGANKKLRMSTTNAATVTDEDRDRDKVTTLLVMSGINLAAGSADSNAIALDVHAYRYLKLLLKITPRTGANTTVRLAFQFRECVSGNVDSSSVYPEYLYGFPPRPMQQDSVVFGVLTGQARQITFAGTDTSAAGHLVTGSATVPWSGEYVVVINGNRSAPGSGVAAIAWSYPNGISIPLDSFTGRPARFDRLQIRMRNMNNNNPGVDYDVKLKAFAQ